MDKDGWQQDGRGTSAARIPRPAGPPATPPPPSGPPQPPAAPPRTPTAVWLNQPRPEAPLGVWRVGFVARPAQPDRERASDKAMLAGLVISFLLGLLVWSLWDNGYVPYQQTLIKVLTPNDWWWPGSLTAKADHAYDAYEARQIIDGVVFGVVVGFFGRLGNWPEAIRHHVTRRPQPLRGVIALLVAGLVLLVVWVRTVPVVNPVLALVGLTAGGEVLQSQTTANVIYVLITIAVLTPFALIGDWRALLRKRSTPPVDAPPPPTEPAPVLPADEWPQLRAAGRGAAADRLAAELRAGRMNDVDCARVCDQWEAVRHSPEGLAAFTDTVLRHGAAAWAHPSGARDLPERAAHHDLLTGQVRIGRCVDSERNLWEYRGAGVALESAVLGTSLLVVGPAGAGKTGQVIRPLVESLSLRALTGRCAVVAVCAAGTPLGPDGAYDVVIRLGDPESVYDLDLYAGATDADEAAGFLAEGLVGDLDGVDTRRAATALAQVLGPYRTAHGRFPTVVELSELLRGAPAAFTALRAALASSGDQAMQRELDARERQAASPTDPGLALADRLALLDRPAFADFFGAGRRADRVFPLGAIAHHPLRVRIDLPERRHAEAAQMLTRLLLAQFGWIAAGRTDRDRFVCLVLDDATHALTAGTVRGIQRLRSVNAGVVLALRTMGDVPDSLHGALHSAVGCRMAFAGVTTWDGRQFAEAWGTRWVETTEVAKHTVFADQPMTRAIHALRRLVTGRDVTTDAVTVRQVERAYWSASELANDLPPGHAVLSLTAVHGDQAPPLLVDLRG